MQESLSAWWLSPTLGNNTITPDAMMMMSQESKFKIENSILEKSG